MGDPKATEGAWYRDPIRLAQQIALHGSIAGAARANDTHPSNVQRAASKYGIKSGNKHTPGGANFGAAIEVPKIVEREAEPAEVLDLQRKLDRAQAEARSLKAQLKAAVKHQNVMEDVRDLLAPVISDCVLPKPTPPKLRRSGDKHATTLVWHLTDLHWGELVDASTLNGVNAYSPEIAASRLQHTVDTILRIAEDQPHGVDEIVVAVNGDTVGGAIHQDSAEYYARVGQQTLDASLVLAQIGFELAAAFPRVRFLGTVGNHPRSTNRMPTGKARNTTSWEWLLHHQVAMLLANAPNVRFEVADGYTLDTQIGPSRWAFAHGDAARGGGGALGIPAYALKKQHDANREWSLALAQMAQQAAHGVVKHSRYGHFHTLFYWVAGAADICLCPSPKGVDSFVLDVLGKYSPPQMLVEVVHPEHDVIAHHPINLSTTPTAPSRYVWNLGVDELHAWNGGNAA